MLERIIFPKVLPCRSTLSPFSCKRGKEKRDQNRSGAVSCRVLMDWVWGFSESEPVYWEKDEWMNPDIQTKECCGRCRSVRSLWGARRLAGVRNGNVCMLVYVCGQLCGVWVWQLIKLFVWNIVMWKTLGKLIDRHAVRLSRTLPAATAGKNYANEEQECFPLTKLWHTND